MNENLKILQYISNDTLRQAYPEFDTVFTSEEQEEIKSVPWRSIVVFDGVDKQIKKIVQMKAKVEKRFNQKIVRSSKAVIFPPSGLLTEEDILKINEELFVSYFSSSAFSHNARKQEEEDIFEKFLTVEKKLEPSVATLLRLYIMNPSFDDVWDDRKLYRIFAIVSFVQQNKYNTFGEFVKENEEQLEKDVREFNFSKFEHFSHFVLNILENRNILAFRDRSLKKNEVLLNSLTQKEMKTIMNRVPEYTPQGRYSSHLQSVIDTVKSKNTMTENEIYKILAEISLSVAQKEEYWSKGMFFKANKYCQEAAISFHEYTKRGAHPDIVLLIRFIEKYQAEMSVMDIVVLLKFLPKANYIIRSTNFEKSMKIFRMAVEKFDNPIGFTRFLTKLFTSHEGIVPSYTEWKKFFDVVGSDEDFSLPMNLLLPMIVSKMEVTSSMNGNMAIVEAVRRNYSTIILPTDKD